MFLLVRAGYEVVESSIRLWRSSILRSSVFRSLGTTAICPMFVHEKSARNFLLQPPLSQVRRMLLLRFSKIDLRLRLTHYKESFQCA